MVTVVKLVIFVLFVLVMVYVLFRLAGYALFRSYYEAKHDFFKTLKNFNNKEVADGKEKDKED